MFKSYPLVIKTAEVANIFSMITNNFIIHYLLGIGKQIFTEKNPALIFYITTTALLLLHTPS